MGVPLCLSWSGVSFSWDVADPPVSHLACSPDEQLMCFVPLCFGLEEYHKKAAVNHLTENLQYMLTGRFVANKAITEQVRLVSSFSGGLLLLRNTGEWELSPDLLAYFLAKRVNLSFWSAEVSGLEEFQCALAK